MDLPVHTFARHLTKVLRYLSLVLLPALTSESSAVTAPQRRPIGRAGIINDQVRKTHLPYLAVIGPISLRFATDPEISPYGPPAPPVITKPIPPANPEHTPSAQDTSHTPVAETPPPETSTTTTTVTSTKTTVPTNTVSILPDDTTRELRPEDVLPFFQYPGSSSSDPTLNIVIPASQSSPKSPPPATQPPSSATYQLK